MDPHIAYYNSTRTNEELLERVDNRQKYMPETIEAALAELTKRGHTFSDEELQVINDDIQALRNNAALVGSRVSAFSGEYKNVIVEDPDAPLMYSRIALYFFTVLTSSLLGSIMLAMNINKTENRGKSILVVLFGIAFLVFEVIIISSFKQPSGFYTLGFGLVAAYCLDYFFWRPFIGYSTFYRARSIWPPIIVVLAIAVVMVLATMYGPQMPS